MPLRFKIDGRALERAERWAEEEDSSFEPVGGGEDADDDNVDEGVDSDDASVHSFEVNLKTQLSMLMCFCVRRSGTCCSVDRLSHHCLHPSLVTVTTSMG